MSTSFFTYNWRNSIFQVTVWSFSKHHLSWAVTMAMLQAHLSWFQVQFALVCNRWRSSGMQVIVSMLRWRNDIEFPSPSSSIFLPGSSPLGLPCLAWDQPGFVRWCVDGDGDVMNVDPLIMKFGVAYGEMGRIVKRMISLNFNFSSPVFVPFNKTCISQPFFCPTFYTDVLVQTSPPCALGFSVHSALCDLG